MRKTTNREHIEGYLYGHKLESKVTGPTSKNPGTPFIRGTLDVAVDDEGMNVLQVNYTYVAPTFGSGKPNATFGVLQKIIDSGVTFVSAGKDATKVSIDTSLDLNDFYTKNDAGEDELVSAKRNDGGFVNIVSALNPDEDKRHTFEFDMVITKTKRVEANEERNTPERVDVTGAIFGYAAGPLPKVIPVTLSCTDTDGGMDYFEGLDLEEQPVFTRVTGLINNVKTVTQTEIGAAFGNKPKVRSTERNYKEWNIDWAAPEPYEYGVDGVLTNEELLTMKQNRETYLATEKARRDEYLASQSTTAAAPKAASTIPAGKKVTF